MVHRIEFKDRNNVIPCYLPDGSVPERSDLRGRRDILKKWEESVWAEAPYAYKDIDKVIKVHREHGMAAPVARMEPIFTVKA